VLDPSTTLHFSIPAGALDVILRSLGEQPWRVVAPVIEMLRQQAIAEHPHAFDTAPLPAVEPVKPNGADAGEAWLAQNRLP